MTVTVPANLEPPFTATATGGWLTITAPDHGRPVLGTPGLWKRDHHDNASMLVCDLPVPDAAALSDSAVLDGADDLDPEERLGALTAWAEATYHGQVDAAWTPPATDDLVELLPEPDRDLSMRRGGLMTAARFTTEPAGRLALGVTIAPVAGDLAGSRCRWLDEVVAGADALRLVRVGLVDDALGAVVRAEVDLSGAPVSALPALLRVGFGALRCIYSGFAPTLSVIGDPAWSSTALDTRDPDAPFRSSSQSS